jgi:twitching motility protein PilT
MATKGRTVSIDPVGDMLTPWLETLWDKGGTDLLLTTGAPPFIRVDSQMTRLPDAPDLDSDTIEQIVLGLVSDEMAAHYKADHDVDFSFSWEGLARFRGNAFRQRRHAALALRMIPARIPSFDELGLPPVIEDMIKVPHGLILVTGPTGSGKSTTLASVIDWLNQNRQCHILTIEDPIEYVHQHAKSAVSQREIGTDAPSFERALRAALREDPDVLLVGEMRDPESIQTALTIAETGHLVLATLHTNDTAQALDRIVDVFPADRRPQIQVQLAATLTGVVYQRLVPKIDQGLTAAFEIMIADAAVRNLVREGKTRQLRNTLTTRQGAGMQTLEMSLAELVLSDTITMETATSVSLYPGEIERHVEMRRQADAAAAAAAAAAASGKNGRVGRRG